MSTRVTDTPTTNAPDAATATTAGNGGAGAPAEIVSYDPATGAEIGRVPLRSAEEVKASVARARGAQAAWEARG